MMRVWWLLEWFGGRRCLRGAEWILVGLGNHGRQYENTRHNVGFIVVDALAERLSDSERAKSCRAEVFSGRLGHDIKVVLAKPQTYVNRSGDALRRLVRRTGLSLSRCLVIVDDFNLPLGKLRFRRRGSDGGHNGLRSIIESVGEDIARLRIGIGPVPDGTAPVEFVLGSFAVSERDRLALASQRAVEAIEHCVTHGIEAAMGRYNC